jgi:hypothetical protein
MTPQCYEVRQFASQYRCDLPGYFRYFETVDDDDKLACIVREPSDPGAKDERIFVRSEKVWSASGTGYEAIRRFLLWEATGLPRGWLLDPNYIESKEP